MEEIISSTTQDEHKYVQNDMTLNEFIKYFYSSCKDIKEIVNENNDYKFDANDFKLVLRSDLYDIVYCIPKLNINKKHFKEI